MLFSYVICHTLNFLITRVILIAKCTKHETVICKGHSFHMHWPITFYNEIEFDKDVV